MVKRYEKSSGGIVYRKRGNKVEILLLRWLNAKNQEIYVIPKGKIENEEVAKDTATREIAEESGLPEEDLEVIKFITKLNYTYTAGYLEDNPVIDKDVYLFLVKYHGTKEPMVSEKERFIGYNWFNIKEINKIQTLFDISSIIMKNKTFFI